MKSLFIIFLLILSLQSMAQKRNTISICLQPNDLGYGLRYDRMFKGFGLYGSLTHGSYKTYLLKIEHHVKASAGIVVYSSTELLARANTFLSLGGCYNIYKGDIAYFEKKVIRPLAVEIGAGFSISWFSIAFRYELVKSNSSIDIGIKF